MEELANVKRDAVNQAGKTLREEAEKQVNTAREQSETYKNAVIEKTREIDNLREEQEKIKRQLKDAEGNANAAWVEARMWMDDCKEGIKKLFAPYTLLNHINAATQSIETVNNLLASYDWDPNTRDKSMQELKNLMTRINGILHTLPNTSSQLLQLPVSSKKQKIASQ
jgi:chromosome segregation ATPase